MGLHLRPFPPAYLLPLASLYSIPLHLLVQILPVDPRQPRGLGHIPSRLLQCGPQVLLLEPRPCVSALSS